MYSSWSCVVLFFLFLFYLFIIFSLTDHVLFSLAMGLFLDSNCSAHPACSIWGDIMYLECFNVSMAILNYKIKCYASIKFVEIRIAIRRWCNSCHLQLINK